MNNSHKSRRASSLAATQSVATTNLLSQSRLYSPFRHTDRRLTDYPPIVPAAAFLIDGPAIRNHRKLLKTDNSNRF